MGLKAQTPLRQFVVQQVFEFLVNGSRDPSEIIEQFDPLTHCHLCSFYHRTAGIKAEPSIKYDLAFFV